MKTIKIAGLEKSVSEIGLGFESFDTLDQAQSFLDRFFEAGGNLFDTAHIYKDGVTETVFGQWHAQRGHSRDSYVLLGKGAHTPNCVPEAIARQLDESLERLQTDFVDIYLMHRDNLEVPVSEFVDAMAAEVDRGRIRGIFGGSNWTKERMDEAIAYARAAGKPEPMALSNSFSLANLIKPSWPGCLAASDPEWRQWLAERQIPNFAWSSQGHGFFTDRAGRDKLTEPDFVASWYSVSNFERRDRAFELAERLGATPVQIALAYALNVDLPIVPLVGPRRPEELTLCLQALALDLTQEQIAWLETGK